MNKFALSCAIVSVCIAGSAMAGDVVWDEFADGDLSSDPEAPTPLEFSFGSNIIIGSMAAPTDIHDYITFFIPDDMLLSELRLLQYEDLNTGGEGNTGFQGIIEGSTSFFPSKDNIDLFLGASHLNWAPEGTDILPLLGDGGLGAQGFEPPLGPGQYTYHVQQTGKNLTGYTLNFVLIPAPGALALLGLTGVVTRQPRRRYE